MTSRNSFFNLLKEDFRRRLWTFILASLVFFGTFIVAFTMVVQNYVERYSRSSYGYTNAEFVERVSRELCQDFYGFYGWFILVAIVGAIICGMSGFAYLHSKKQMDFYHSLPVKRETIFAVRFVNGILIYAVPYMAGLLYTYLLCTIYGVMTTDILSCSLFYFALHLMGYIIMYLVTILAMMLTGKLLIGFFGTCVLNLYAPAVYVLVMGLKEVFFVTTYNDYVELEDALLVTKWISPGSFYFNLIYALQDGDRNLWPEFFEFLVLAAVLAVLVLILYKKRASEKADTAMSFKATEPVIRMMISIPVGVVAGLLFFALQYDNNGVSVFWLVFGGLLGGFLAHGIIEALYNGDIKKCLSHKVQMVVTMVVAAVVPLAFLYDIFGYDSYLPEKEEIANMAVISSDLRFGGSYYDEDGWMSPNEYALENMEVTDIDAMYELAEILSESASKNRTDNFFGYHNYYVDDAEKMYETDFIIRYTLKNGSEVTRRYDYNYYKVLDLLERIYSDVEFKTAVHPVFGLLESNWKIQHIECYSPAYGVSRKLEKNCENILTVYAEEVLEMTFEELKTTSAIGELTAHFMVNAENEYTDSSTFIVYPSMTRTIALLKEQGYTMKDVQNSDNIESITVSYGGSINDLKRTLGMEVSEDTEKYYSEGEATIVYESYGEVVYYPVTKEEYQDIVLEFTEPAEIAEIKKSLIHRSYSHEFGPFPEVSAYISAEVYFETDMSMAEEDGLVGWTERFRFLEDRIPQFVIDRLLKELEAGVN